VETSDVLMAVVVEAVLPPTKFLSERKVPAAPPPALTEISCALAPGPAAEPSSATKDSRSSERIALVRFFILYLQSGANLEVGLVGGGLNPRPVSGRDEARENPSGDRGKK
jgi:hypothetical protein